MHTTVSAEAVAVAQRRLLALLQRSHCREIDAGRQHRAGERQLRRDVIALLRDLERGAS